MNRFADKASNKSYDKRQLNADLNFYIKHYLVFPEEWILKLKCLSSLAYADYTMIIKPTICRALFDFYSDDFLKHLNKTYRIIFEKQLKPFDRCMNYRYFKQLQKFCFHFAGMIDFTPIFKEELSFPHSKLRNVLLLYSQFSTVPISKEIIQKVIINEKFYTQLQALESTSEKWFDTIIKNDDQRFIIQNIELRIAKTPFDQDLWKRYVCYLKAVNEEAATEVYYRYRRLFLDDKNLEPYFPNFVPKDQQYYDECKGFLYYMKFKNFENRRNNLTFTKNQQLDYDFTYEYHNLLDTNVASNPCSTFYYTSSVPTQNFNFRSTIIHYLIKKASAEIMSKLYKTCKYFFNHKNQPICYSLYFGENMNVKYCQNSLTLKDSTFNGLNNLWIQNALFILPKSNPVLLSKIIPKIGCCTIRFLMVLCVQRTTLSEFKFLTNSKRIIYFHWRGGSVIDDYGNLADIKELFEALPKARVVEMNINTTIHFANEFSTTTTKKQPDIQILKVLLPSNVIDVGAKYFADILLKQLTKNSATTILSPPSQLFKDFKKDLSSYFQHHSKHITFERV